MELYVSHMLVELRVATVDFAYKQLAMKILVKYVVVAI
jgi:hypothetical protein